MTLFDFTFGLSAVILGLALTQMASSLHRLAMAGRRVKWAPEPLMLAVLVFLVIVSVWLYQWDDRLRTTTTIGLVLLNVLKLLFPYLAAAFVLPEQPEAEGEVDLYAHYDRTRPFTYGAMICGLLLFWVTGLVGWVVRVGIPQHRPLPWIDALAEGPWVVVALYGALIWIRNRWVHRLALLGAVGWYGWSIAGISLTQ